MLNQLRRYAANEVIFNGEKLPLHVVEIKDGKVIRVFPLKGEPPFTIWIRGTIRVVKNNGMLIAYNGNKILE
jgi:hypothetical protein